MKIKEEYKNLDIQFLGKRYILRFLPKELYPHMVNRGLSGFFECECGKDLDKCECECKSLPKNKKIEK